MIHGFFKALFEILFSIFKSESGKKDSAGDLATDKKLRDRFRYFFRGKLPD